MLPSSDDLKILAADVVGSDERRDQYEARKHRRKRKALAKEVLDGHTQPTYKYIDAIATHAIEESRLLGYDHDLLILPPRYYNEVSTDYTAAVKLMGDSVPKLSRDESDETVVITVSRSIESPILVDSSVLDLSVEHA